MIRKVSLAIFVCLLTGILFINSYIKLEFDMNLLEYLQSNSTLTKEEVEYLKDHNTLIYGADYNSPPLRYVNPDSKQYEGLSIDYLRALEIELGINIEFKPMIWNDALIQLSKGNTDFCDMYKSKERSKNFLFSNPIYYQRGAILIKNGNKSIHSAGDLENKTISGNKGDLVFEFIKENYTNVTPIESPDLKAAIDLLNEGKVDAVLGDESVMSYFISQDQNWDDFTILDDYLYEREAVLAVSKENEMLLSILNKGINNLNKKKTMEKIYQKWFGNSPLITKNINIEKYILITKYSVLFAVILSLSLYSWNIQLKKEVTKRTNELFLSKNELETTFNGLTHLMVVVNEDCVVTEANNSFCNTIDYPKNKIKNMHCFTINGILGTDCEKCVMKKTMDKQQSIMEEVKHQNRFYKVSTFILEQLPNTKKRVLIMMEDVTDFKLAEQQMLQSNKMAAIGQLAAGIAHEIRNPLGIIRNYSYLLKKTNPDSSDSVKVIESSVDRANKIIDNLLNFSRLTDNKRTNTNVYMFIKNILDLNEKNLKSKKIKASVNCEPGIEIPINIESLKHVLINLISNSSDAMSEGGNIHIDVQTHKNELLICVEDDGCGMEDDIIANIFNPFYTTKSPGLGTGLGLYITYNEVQKMNGSIKVNSEIGKGTKFTISIPSKV